MASGFLFFFMYFCCSTKETTNENVLLLVATVDCIYFSKKGYRKYCLLVFSC